MGDKKILKGSGNYVRTGDWRILINGEWHEFSARARDAGERIYNPYVMWDMQGIPDADSVSMMGIELDTLHSRISEELNDSVWSDDYSKRYLSMKEYMMLADMNDMIYVVLKASMVNHSSDELEEAVCGEDQ